MVITTIDKAVWLEDMARVRDVIDLLERIYDTDGWTGGLLLQDIQGGFVLVACFDAAWYTEGQTRFESLFPSRDILDITLEEALSRPNRYRPWLGGELHEVLRELKLLPT